MAELLEVTGLWEKVDKNGNTYFDGTLGFGLRMVILKNQYKKESNHPDFKLFLQKKEKTRGDYKKRDEQKPRNDDLDSDLSNDDGEVPF